MRGCKPKDLITRLDGWVTPEPSLHNRDMCWFYVGPTTVSHANQPLYRRVRATRKSLIVDLRVFQRRLLPASISHMGEITTVARALWRHFRGPELVPYPTKPFWKGIRLDFTHRRCLTTHTARSLYGELPNGVPDHAVHCCNPWHIEVIDSRLTAMPEELLPTRHNELCQLIEDWTSTNPHASIDLFHELYTHTGDWTALELANAIQALSDRKDLTPRWRALLTAA